MLISDMYLETDDFIVYIFLGNFCTYFQFPLMFLTKELGTPYQVSFLPVGAPNKGWWPRWVVVWITGIVVLYPSMSFPSQNVSTMCSLMSGKAVRVLRTRAVRFSMPLMYSPMNVMLSQSSTMYLCR